MRRRALLANIATDEDTLQFPLYFDFDSEKTSGMRIIYYRVADSISINLVTLLKDVCEQYGGSIDSTILSSLGIEFYFKNIKVISVTRREVDFDVRLQSSYEVEGIFEVAEVNYVYLEDSGTFIIEVD